MKWLRQQQIMTENVNKNASMLHDDQRCLMLVINEHKMYLGIMLASPAADINKGSRRFTTSMLL